MFSMKHANSLVVERYLNSLMNQFPNSVTFVTTCAQIHSDNYMFSKRLYYQSYHIMKTGINRDTFGQIRTRSFKNDVFCVAKFSGSSFLAL